MKSAECRVQSADEERRIEIKYEVSAEQFEKMIRDNTAVDGIRKYLQTCVEMKINPTVESVRAILRGCGYES